MTVFGVTSRVSTVTDIQRQITLTSHFTNQPLLLFAFLYTELLSHKYIDLNRPMIGYSAMSNSVPHLLLT